MLKLILEYVENPDIAPISVLWLYVILLPACDMVRSIAENQALWIGRKICIRIRAIAVGEIYAKALRRKAAAGNDSVLGDTAKGDKDTFWDRMKRLVGLKKKNKQGTERIFDRV